MSGRTRPARAAAARGRRAAATGALVALAAAVTVHAAEPSRAALRVCADPANPPLSNNRLEGFENRIASLIAHDLGLAVRYTWADQRVGFMRRTLNARQCDVVMGVPSGMGNLATTRAYYASSYVFVSQRGKAAVSGFDDPALKAMRIGLEALGFEGANTPPAMSLARRGLAANVVGYTRMDADNAPNPSARIVDAVAAGEVDIGILWGPIAGYFAKQYGDRLVVTPVTADAGLPTMPFTFEIALGTRPEDTALNAKLQAVLDRRAPEIRQILSEYGVPLLPAPPS